MGSWPFHRRPLPDPDSPPGIRHPLIASASASSPCSHPPAEAASPTTDPGHRPAGAATPPATTPLGLVTGGNAGVRRPGGRGTCDLWTIGQSGRYVWAAVDEPAEGFLRTRLAFLTARDTPPGSHGPRPVSAWVGDSCSPHAMLPGGRGPRCVAPRRRAGRPAAYAGHWWPGPCCGSGGEPIVSDSQQMPARTWSVLVTMPPVIDAASGDHIGRELSAVLSSGASTVIADLTGTRSCNCAGLRILFAAIAKAAECGTDLRLVVPPAGVVQQTLRNSGLSGLLPIYPTLRSARPPGPVPVTFLLGSPS